MDKNVKWLNGILNDFNITVSVKFIYNKFRLSEKNLIIIPIIIYQ